MSDFLVMKPEREMAVRAMQILGWTAERRADRAKPHWRFTRPDTGGLRDVWTCPQASLSMSMVADLAMKHGDADGLAAEIAAAKDRWLKERFAGLYQIGGAA